MRKKVFGVLQRIGRSFMLPIAVLPIAGMFLGIGSSLTNEATIASLGMESILGYGTILNQILTLLMAVGQTMPNLNVPIVSNFMIILPPLSVQKEYYDFVAEVDKSKADVQKALDQTQLLFDSLMQQYFG
jgi:phosphotransferase system  glucose/maltose/N-acetylglucosamine-specific IIC component